MAHDVFICYSYEDKLTADLVCNFLERNGVRCWIAPRDVVPGKEWAVAIIEAIEKCKIFVLIFSQNADASPQVLREVERGVSKSKIIVPFRIANVIPSKALEYYLSVPHWLDALTEPIEQHVDKLVNTILLFLRRTISHVPESEPTTQAKTALSTNIQTVLATETKEPSSKKPVFFTKHWKNVLAIGLPLIIILSVIIILWGYFVSKQTTTNLEVNTLSDKETSKEIMDEDKNKDAIEQNASPDKRTTEELKISKVNDNLDHTETRHEQGNVDKAKDHSKQSTFTENKQTVLNTNDAVYYVNQGIDYLNKNQHDDAITNFTKALETNPRCLEAYYNRGLANYTKGLYYYTISDCNKAIELDQNCYQAYWIRGAGYVGKGGKSLANALQDCSIAININPRCAEAYYIRGHYYMNDAISWINKGSSFSVSSSFKKAITDFNTALSINPDYASAYYYRGVAYFYKRKFFEAWNDIHKAQSLGIQPQPEFIAKFRKESGRQN
ncbi:MAG: hypothetical protein B6D35_06050 [Candidatus Brocadia sp. UTAMX2]|nr:MAG: hypothetical protein B6D35_06050 [Candidatus Brocadia sp. UTAMX2]